MSFDGNVLPGILAGLKTLQAGPTSGQATPTGKLMSVHLGEQWKVTGRGPVAWVMGGDWSEPEPGGSDLEMTAWSIEVRLLYQFAADQRHAEEVLMALIEPIRDVFRKHRKLQWTAASSPTGIAINASTPVTRTRVASGRWRYIAVNGIMYRMLTLNILVGEKIGQTYQAGT